MFGNSKMELDSTVWPLLESQIRTVWVSATAPMVHSPEPVTEILPHVESNLGHSVFRPELSILRNETFLRLAIEPSTYLFLHLLLFLLVITLHHASVFSFASFASFVLVLCHFITVPEK